MFQADVLLDVLGNVCQNYFGIHLNIHVDIYGGYLKPETLIEIIDAAHLTYLVESPFKQRGGIMLIAPPGQLKSSMIQYALQGYNDCLIMSDINVKTLVELRGDLVASQYTTLAFTALEKLYARHSSTASNIEATLMALAEEGFTRASFEDQRQPMRPARALIIGGTFQTMVDRKWTEWKNSGFARRFIWCNYSIENTKELLRAVQNWKPINFGKFHRVLPIGESIEYNLTEEDSSFVMDIMKPQRETTPTVLMKKIFCVLKWKYSENVDRAYQLVKDFSDALKKDGANMILPTSLNLKTKEAKFEL